MRTTTRRLVIGTAALLLTTTVAAPALADDGTRHRDRQKEPLVTGALVGSLTTDPPLAGVAPGAADWTVSRSRVRITTDGRVDIRVRDLVLTSTGANPVATVSASLVCNGAVVDTVGPVAFSGAGSARIRDRFAVPDRCLAPAVLLNPATRTTAYIAASGAAR